MNDHTTAAQPLDPSDMDDIEALALAAPQVWYGTYQIADGITDEKAIALIEACSPDTILALIAQARAAQPESVAPSDNLPYRVAEFWSSANPSTKVRMLAEGDNIAQWPKRGDFIRWVETPSATGTPEASPASQPVAPSAPIAYAVYGINAYGKHYLRAVKAIDASENWTTDDDGLGERWAGNEPMGVLAPASTASQPVAPALMRQAVASVISRVGNELRVGWLRPESCDVGTLLYCASEPVPAVAPSDATGKADAANAGGLTPLDYQAQGREEALAIILAQSAEDPFSDCIGWGKSGAPEDEGACYWKEDELRALLHISDRTHDAYDRAEAAYWDALGRKDEAAREMLFVEQAPFYKPLHDFLRKHEAWDLMGDLKRAASQSPATSAADAKDAWREGVLIALSVLVSMYDVPTMAASVLGELGISDADCSNLDEFDKVNLRKIQAAGRGMKLRGLSEDAVMAAAPSSEKGM